MNKENVCDHGSFSTCSNCCPCKNCSKLYIELDKLRNAIRYHRDQKGHDRCWLDDIKLYELLPEGVADYDGSLPPEEEFLENCKCYYKLRTDHLK